MAKKKFKKPKHLQASPLAKAKQAIEINHSELLSFSLKYFVVVEDKFDPFIGNVDYFNVLIERLKAISTITIGEFYANRSSALRIHPIDWGDTTEDNFGLNNEEQLVNKPYQFELTANEYGRVHGFLIGSVYYISSVT